MRIIDLTFIFINVKSFLLNYAFSNNEYDEITGEDILKFVIKGTRYTDLQKLDIMDDAMVILKIKYNKVIVSNRKEQFMNLDFNK